MEKYYPRDSIPVYSCTAQIVFSHTKISCKTTVKVFVEWKFHALTLLIILLDITWVKLLSSIGQGSFGTVYRAIWRGSLLAAKVIQMREEIGMLLVK